MSNALMAVRDNWLDAGGSTSMSVNSGSYIPGHVETTTTGACVGGTGDYWGSTFYYPWPYYYPVYQSSPARPIRLTLSEVERLRKAAKADGKLKSILQKFTLQIEITVDFE